MLAAVWSDVWLAWWGVVVVYEGVWCGAVGGESVADGDEVFAVFRFGWWGGELVLEFPW